MALKYSSMLELGTTIPEFELINVLDGALFASASLRNNKPSLIMVICNHCPYVIQYHDELKRLTDDYGDFADLVAISSNDVDHYPQDGPEPMKDLFTKLGLVFPYLFDESQELARLLKAECTPEFYLFDQNNTLVYRGRLDDTSPGKASKPTGNDLREALNCLLAGDSIDQEQLPSIGCSIKWK
jgi:thioredoxin-related protein